MSQQLNYCHYKSLVEIINLHAEQQAERIAFCYLTAANSEITLSFSQIDRRARAIAVILAEKIRANERVLLIYLDTLNFICGFLGCLYAGVIAVPIYLPRFNRSYERVISIAKDSGACMALTNMELENYQPIIDNEYFSTGLEWLNTNDINLARAKEWHIDLALRSNFAFLQYTSGSTGAPKGVIISQQNLLHNLEVIRTAFSHTMKSQVVSWLPPYHDMGLVGSLLQPLYVGFSAVALSPADFLQHPIRWLQAINKYGGTSCGGPNFAYDYCVQRIKDDQLVGLDLSRWEIAFCGAEPIRATTIDNFTRKFAAYGFREEAFYACYGMAEATLFVTGGPKLHKPRIRSISAEALKQNKVSTPSVTVDNYQIVSCGINGAVDEILIVNPLTKTVCEPNQIGEVWLRGQSIAEGYWCKPDITHEIFHAHLEGRPEPTFLRTGDLGFIHNNELFITGRIKDLIIIDGRNLYPQDIESTIEQCHPAVRASCVSAFALDIDDTECLIVALELERSWLRGDHSTIATAIKRSIVEQHQVSVYAIIFLAPGKIPKTSSGKIQRHACCQAFSSGQWLAYGSQA